MTAGVYDILCEQGATFRKTFTWLDENEQPVDLTGCSARMQVRPSHKGTTTWLDLTGIAMDPALGQLLVVLTATVTAALPVSRGVYDLEVVHPTGDVTRLLQGTFTVSPEVTR
jgi:hypothetical protein